MTMKSAERGAVIEGEWWYMAEGERHGPHTLAELRSKLMACDISAHTMIWHKGIQEWADLSEVDDARLILNDLPPPLVGQEADIRTAPGAQMTEPRVKLSPAGAWSRFFARSIDMSIWIILLTFFLGVTAEIAGIDISRLGSSRFGDDDIGSLYDLASLFILFPAALFLDAAATSIFGTTFGKWLHGIRVRSAQGQLLRFKELIIRNLSLWVYGLSFNIPLLNIICLILNYKIVEAGKRCRWDERRLHNVLQLRAGKIWHVIGFITWLLVCIVLPVWLSYVDPSTNTPGSTGEHVTNVGRTDSAPGLWVNPATGISVRLDDGWVQRAMETEGSAFFFRRKDLIVALILGNDEHRNVEECVEYLVSTGDFGILIGSSIDMEPDGVIYRTMRYAGDANGRPVDIQIRVWESSPTTFWYSVAVAPSSDTAGKESALSAAKKIEATTLSQAGRR